MRTRRMVIAVVVGGLAIFGASACGDDSDSGGDGLSADDVDIDVSDEIPDDFPRADVPLPDEQLTSATSIEIAGQRSWTFVFDVTDVQVAVDLYRDRLDAAGFVAAASFEGEDIEGDLASFTVTNDEHFVTAFAGGVRGESTLSVTVAPATLG